VISVILLPLTLLASVMGMNVRVPGQNAIGAFWIVIGVMAITLVGLLMLARRRGWL
jgi:magnesium transporter